MKQVIMFSVGAAVGLVAGLCIAMLSETSKISQQRETIGRLEATAADQLQQLTKAKTEASEKDREYAEKKREHADNIQRERDSVESLSKWISESTSDLVAERLKNAKLAEAAESKIDELEAFWTYRSPTLTRAMRDFAESAHEIEDTYTAGSENYLEMGAKAYHRFGTAIMHAIEQEQWPLPRKGSSSQQRGPYDAMRDMADALRKYEAGTIGNAEFIEAQADFLESVDQSIRGE